MFVKPCRFYLEGASQTRIRVHRTSELRHTVALEGYILDGFAEECVTVSIEGLDSDIDVLLVGIEEQHGARGRCGTY